MTIKKWTFALGFTAGLTLVACSGENGTDGAPGADGAEGTSCVAEALENGSGFDMICGGKSVGTVKNGEDGADGKDGTNGKDGKDGADGKNGTDGKDGIDGKDGSSCVVKPLDGGFKVLCDGDSVGVLVNGIDGKDGVKGDSGVAGKSVYELAVEAGFEGTEAEWIASLKGGKGDAGADGVSCELADNGDGTVTVTCGENATTLFKAVCGTAAYDPATHFCQNEKVYPLCTEEKVTYDATQKFCLVPGGDLADLCGGKTFDPATHYCVVDAVYPLCADGPYNPEKCFCFEDKYIVAYCGDKVEYDPTTQACTKVGTSYSVYPACGHDTHPLVNPSDYVDLDYEGEFYVSLFNNTMNINAFSLAIGSTPQMSYRVVDGEYVTNRGYNPDSAFCDTRDSTIYTFKKIGATTWMTSDLKYLDTVATPTLKEDGAYSCPSGEPENCKTTSVYYRWNIAMDLPASALTAYQFNATGYTDATTGGYNPEPNYQGLCPDGWHVPLFSDLSSLNTYGDQYRAVHSLPSVWAALQETVNATASLWGATEWAEDYLENGPHPIGAAMMTNSANAYVTHGSTKKNLAALRCVKN